MTFLPAGDAALDDAVIVDAVTEAGPGPARAGSGSGSWREALLVALPAWATARVVVLVALGFARYLADELPRGTGIVSRTVHQGLLAWDGSWYVDIARYGYGALPDEALRFFPGFPLLGRALGVIVGEDAALVLVANVAALLAIVLVYRLVRWERDDAQLATRAAWLLSLAPPAFVFVMGYSDSIAIALAIAAFLAARRRQWWWAAAAAVALGVCRPTGFIIALPLAIEAISGFSRTALRDRLARVAAVVAAPLGALVYLVWVGAEYGDWLLPYRVQTAGRFRGEFANPLTTVWHAIEGGFDGNVGTALHVPWLVVLIGLTVVVFLRWPLSYGVFAAAVVLSTVTSENLASLERYGLFAFPLVLAAADLTGRKLVERVVFILVPVALFAYASLAFLGLFVP